MPRRAARVDDNQEAIVRGLRKIPGVRVAVTSDQGRGFPDLVVGFQGVNYLMEIKDGSKPPSRRSLTEDEQVFHDLWTGQVAVVESLEEAMSVIGV